MENGISYVFQTKFVFIANTEFTQVISHMFVRTAADLLHTGKAESLIKLSYG